MHRIVVNVLRLPIAHMLGDDMTVCDDPHAIERTDGGYFTMGVLRWHAVVVPIEPDQRQAVGLRRPDTPRLEAVTRDFEHRESIFFEQLRFRARLTSQLTTQISEAVLGQLLIELLEVIKLRNGLRMVSYLSR